MIQLVWPVVMSDHDYGLLLIADFILLSAVTEWLIILLFDNFKKVSISQTHFLFIVSFLFQISEYE